MKIDRFETHDRLIEFSNQKDYISQGCQDCIKNRPSEFLDHPFYIFAHCRTHDNGYSKRLIWEPRLTKPKAQTNSMLFKVYPPGDEVKIIWMIPNREQWDSYETNLMLSSNITANSIREFRSPEKRKLMEQKENDDLSDHEINWIYSEISKNAKAKQVSSGASLTLMESLLNNA